ASSVDASLPPSPRHSFPTRRSSDLILPAGRRPSSRHSRSQGPSIMKIRRLLHPTDFSSASGPAFKLALELARNRASLQGQLEGRSEEHTSELQSPDHLVCRLLLEKK